MRTRTGTPVHADASDELNVPGGAPRLRRGLGPRGAARDAGCRKPLDQRWLARELTRYGVKSKAVRMPDGRTPKGYTTDGPEGLADAWKRYLPDSGATGATGATQRVMPVADDTGVAFTSATGTASATHLTSTVPSVADVEPESRTPRTRDHGTRGAAPADPWEVASAAVLPALGRAVLAPSHPLVHRRIRAGLS